MAGRRTPGLRHAPRTRTTESNALPSGRHIQVLVNGEPLATTYRPALIIEGPGLLLDGLDGTNPPLPVWSYLQPLSEAACLAGLIGIPDDDPAVHLLINDSPARHTNAG